MIYFDIDQQLFHLQNETLSYIIQIAEDGSLLQRYYGPRIRHYRQSNAIQTDNFRSFNINQIPGNWKFSLTELPQEITARGYGDYRLPSLTVRQENGAIYHKLRYSHHEIQKGKPELPGMPATKAQEQEAETLLITMEDQKLGLRVVLYYTLYAALPVICRHQRIYNDGPQPFIIENCQSLSLDLPPQALEMVSLWGADLKEGTISRAPLHQGIQEISSTRGFSSPQHQPFFALVSPDTTFQKGTCYGFHLIYSGNFTGRVEVDQFENIRLQMGLHPDTFQWELSPDDCFTSPEVVLNFNQRGLNGMAQTFHKLYQHHLMPQQFAHKLRPLLLNTWEAMYTDIDLDKITDLAKCAANSGLELLVMDDGWFGKRNYPNSSLGDWYPDEEKLPGGITAAAEIVHSFGLQFGLWFEPEMISEKSRLFEEHPEWAFHIPGYQNSEGRFQYVLNLAREDVQTFIIDMLRGFLQTGDIDYVKWDANRQLSEVFWDQLPANRSQEIWHRYILGLYHILETVTGEFPEVLFEGCCSGGGRFDPGMLYYMPQTWASDNSDPVSRLSIQSGYGLLYPPIAITCHVSASPNHQVGRVTSLDARFAVASFGNLGYELNLLTLSQEELTKVNAQVTKAKELRPQTQLGSFYQLDTPDENFVAWQTLSSDGSKGEVMVFQKLVKASQGYPCFKLTALDSEADYLFADSILGGDELQEVGFTLPAVLEDFHPYVIEFKRLTH
jgi:alpha-galactosidase